MIRTSRRKFYGVLVGSFAILMGGCTATIEPPDAPRDPVGVYLLKNAFHRGLWLPREAGGFVEYGYGDWRWYALDESRWYRLFPTLLWPTKGALARRANGSRDGEALAAYYYWTSLDEIQVERERMVALRSRLDDEFERLAEQAINSRSTDLEFVPIERSYHAWNNCNDVVAEWLEELGCEVSWCFVRRDLKLESTTAR